MVLITGGFGYLGGRIAEYLWKSGYSVRIGTRKIELESNVSHPHYDLVQLNLFNKKSLEAACKNITIIIHLAAMNAQESVQEPEKAFQINVEGTSKLINAAVNENVEKFIYFSTAHIYGSPLKGHLTENISPSPLHPYALTHYLAEEVIMKASKNQSINGIVLRLSNAIGTPSNQNANCWMLVANDLCKQVITNKIMTIKSNFFVERDFISISEVCKVVENIITSLNLKEGVFNLSSGSSLTLMELANLISKRSTSMLQYTPQIECISKKDSLSIHTKNLYISNNKLKKYGVKINKDISFEIDDLLVNCSKWFSK
jgi:UDP-glucose 4-epimerase